MPIWQPKPPDEATDYAHRIVRTPATKPLVAIVTSALTCGTPTHFLNNRTTPCDGTDACDACKAGYSSRWHGYLGALITWTLEHVLFEYTAAAASTFQSYLETHDTLRGCLFKAHRPSGRANGRVVIQAQPADLAKWRLPDPPEIERILCHIWGVAPETPPPQSKKSCALSRIGIMPDNGDGRNRA